MAKDEQKAKVDDMRVDSELINLKTIKSEQIDHAIKTAAKEATVIDIDDFDEGVALGTETVPPGFPKKLRNKRGEDIPVIPIRIAKATCTSHKLWPYVTPATPESAPDVPKRYFNAEGILQMGDLIVCMISKNIYDRMKEEARSPLAAMVKKWNRGGTDYGQDSGPVTDVFPGGERYSGGVRFRKREES